VGGLREKRGTVGLGLGNKERTDDGTHWSRRFSKATRTSERGSSHGAKIEPSGAHRKHWPIRGDSGHGRNVGQSCLLVCLAARSEPSQRGRPGERGGALNSAGSGSVPRKHAVVKFPTRRPWGGCLAMMSRKEFGPFPVSDWRRPVSIRFNGGCLSGRGDCLYPQAVHIRLGVRRECESGEPDST
jgi:hypothetical protein